MTVKEALKEITKNQKWYNWARPEPMNQSTASLTALRILQGNCKPDTMKRFFSAFGYTLNVKYEITKNDGTVFD